MTYKEPRTESNKDVIDGEIISPASYVNTNLREAVEDDKRHSQVRQNVTGGASTILLEQQEDEDETKFFLRFRIILHNEAISRAFVNNSSIMSPSASNRQQLNANDRIIA
jgi:predicted DNA-binding helix-hairpin-helix protein